MAVECLVGSRKSAVTLTRHGYFQVWNSFLTTESEPADGALSGDALSCLATMQRIRWQMTAVPVCKLHLEDVLN